MPWIAMMIALAVAASPAAAPDTSARAATAGATTTRALPPDSAAGCPRVSKAQVELGRPVFGEDGGCFACHGLDAHGTVIAPDLTDAKWLDTDGSYSGIVRVVRKGVAKPKAHPAPMAPLGGTPLTASQVCAVSAYVYALSHP